MHHREQCPDKREQEKRSGWSLRDCLVAALQLHRLPCSGIALIPDCSGFVDDGNAGQTPVWATDSCRTDVTVAVRTSPKIGNEEVTGYASVAITS
jgi:hypothetical protein